MSIPDFDSTEEMRKERRAANAAAALFVRACQTGDVVALYEAVDLINHCTVDGWKVAMRTLARQVRAVSPKIQSAFLRVWMESKMLPLVVGDYRALCDAARVLSGACLDPASW